MQCAITFERTVMKIHYPYYSAKAIALLCCAMAFVVSCTHRSEDFSRVFCYNESNGISSLDPAFARDLEIMWATNQLFDGLVEMDSALNVVPLIAKSWNISDNGKLYTFYLHNDVFFHSSPLFTTPDARRVTAQDFVYSFKRILDPKVASPGQWIFAQIDTSRAGGFEAVNDTTLQIYLKQPFQPFLGMLTTQYCNVVPHEVVEHYGADFRSHPIGTGPFQFAFWYENVALVFHRHPKFWQKDAAGNVLPYLDAVKIDLVKDMSVEYQGLLQGRYDFMSGIHPAFKDELLTADGNLRETYANTLRLQRTPFIKTDYLGFVLDAGDVSPLQDVRVRKALNMAIDKKAMVRYLRNNTVFAAGDRFVPPVLLPAGSGDDAWSYQPAEAKRLLQQAGYNNSFQLTMSATGDYADLLEYIQHEWEKIGVKSEVQIMQSSAFRDATAKTQLMCFRKSWLADYADAENFFALFTSKNFAPTGPNYTHYHNEAFDAVYTTGCTVADSAARNMAYRTMDQMLRDDLPAIPLFYDQVTHFVRNNVSGLQTNPVNMLDVKWVRKNDTNHVR